MKNIIMLVLVVLTFGSCRNASLSVKNSFSVKNKEILDSLKIYENDNQALLDLIDFDNIQNDSLGNLFMVNLLIVKLNTQLEDAIKLISESAESPNDLNVSYAVLIKNNTDENIKSNSISLMESLRSYQKIYGFEDSLIDGISPKEENYSMDDWVKKNFYQLPVYASISILNKWRLENEKLMNKWLKMLILVVKKQANVAK